MEILPAEYVQNQPRTVGTRRHSYISDCIGLFSSTPKIAQIWSKTEKEYRRNEERRTLQEEVVVTFQIMSIDTLHC